MKLMTMLCMAASVLALTQITGCKEPPVDPPAQVEVCNPTNISYSNNGRNITAVLSYNSVGNPVSMIVTSPGTANPHSYFRYDQFNRLTDFVGPYTAYDPANPPSQISFEVWVKYTYADQNPASMPIADTLRSMGFYNNGVFSPVTAVSNYSYDAQGRISKINATSLVYDSNGNLVVPNRVYDNMKNFMGGNEILMFVNKDYSVNNPFTATTYNSNGLPVTVPNSLVFFNYHSMYISTLGYACSTSGGGNKKLQN